MELLELHIGHRIAYVKGFNVNGNTIYVNIETGLVETTWDSAILMRPVQRNIFHNEINNCKLPIIETVIEENN